MKLIYFDICAVLIMAPIIIAMCRKQMNHGLINRWFLMLCSCILFTAIADCLAVGLDLSGPDFVMWKYIAHTLYLLGRAYVTPICIGYLLARLGMWYRADNYGKALFEFFALSYIPVIFLVVINPIFHVMFYIDASGNYTRGSLLLVSYAISALYALFGLGAILKYAKIIGVRKAAYLLIVFMICILATAFQFVFPYIIIESFAMAIACLILALGVQAPEERMYGRTSLFKTSAFAEDMNTAESMGAPVSMAIVCLNNYDTLREMVGFEVMNSVLDYISDNLNTIRRELRADYEFYYLGRGQFITTLWQDNKDKIINFAHSINSWMLEDIPVNEISINFNANVCVARFPEDIENLKDIIPFAEVVKSLEYTGEVRYAEKLFDKKEYDVRRNINSIIDNALENNTLHLVYQPIYSVEMERYYAAESFLRLSDPEYGDISPQLLIREAERSGSIHGITTYLFEEICKFVSGPEFMQLNFGWIEMNLSPTQCMWKDLVTVLSSLMEAYHVDPGKICLNIIDENDNKFHKNMFSNLQKLSEMGVVLYMDDFGAGVFEIERITKLPLTGIKLDRELIKMGIEQDATLVLENSVRMIRDMGMDCVAVGIEDLSMRRRLVEMGCINQQGYYYCMPLEKRDLIVKIVGTTDIKG